MSTGTLSPIGQRTFLDNSGLPLSGGLIYTYTAGTSTPATTYTDADLLVPNTNPIVCNSSGRCTIYLAATSYKYQVKTSAGVLLWTEDPVTAVNAGSSGLGEIYVFGGQSSTPVTSATYPSGALFTVLHGGTGVYEVDSSTLSGTYNLTATGVVSAGTMTVAIVNLTDGAPDTPLATCAFTSTTGQVVTSSAITFGSGGSTKQYGIKAKITTGSGYAFGIALVRTV